MAGIMFTTFRDTKDPTRLKNAMKAAITSSALVGEGKEMDFVAAKNYLPPQATSATKPIYLFLTVDKATEFVNFFNDPTNKKRFPKIEIAYGEAKISKDTEGNHRVLISKVKGALTTAKIRDEVIGKAIGTDAKVTLITAEDLAKQSRITALREGAEARKAGQDDPELMNKPGIHQVTGEMGVKPFLETLAKQRTQIDEFMRFAEAYRKLANDYDFEDNSLTIPGKVWLAMIQNMAKSGYVTKLIPKGADGRFKLTVDGPNGTKVREALLEQAMAGMQVFIRHAENNLDKVVKAVKANRGKTWAFWSGTGAKEAAQKEAGGGLVLEGSIGSWFDNIWRFEHLTGVSDMVLWTSMSELYARKAAEHYQDFKFIGFMGPGSTKDTTVWSNIEKPTLIQVLNVQQQVPIPDFTWYVVQCDQSRDKKSWIWSGAASKAFPSRSAAETEVKRRYTE